MAFNTTGMILSCSRDPEMFSTRASGGGSVIAAPGRMAVQLVDGQMKAEDYINLLEKTSLRHEEQ